MVQRDASFLEDPSQPIATGDVDVCEEGNPRRILAISLPLPAEDTKTQDFLQRAYDGAQAYQKPPLSPKAKVVGPYVWDEKPTDFDNQCLVRETAAPVHSDVMHCSVQGNFIDEAVFRDGNILLEIIQNAECNDSKGTWFAVEFYAKGKWRSAIEGMHEFTDEEIEAVRIVDNGKGYLPTDMTTIGGGKRNDPTSAGRFGSGMKVADRSALGKGVRVVRYSRNWRATPYLRPSLTSHGHDSTVSYQVAFFEDVFPGSVVEYRNLTPKMMHALRRIGDYYLPLDKTVENRLLARSPSGLILEPREGQNQIMAHGRSYEFIYRLELPLLFSYDLHDCPIYDQNRHYVGHSEAIENIRKIWSETQDTELFKRFFASAAQGDERKYYEHEMDGLDSPSDAFKQAAKEYYGIKDLEKAYICDDREETKKQEEILDEHGYQGIKIGDSRFIKGSFCSLRIVSGRDVLRSITRERYVKGNLVNYQGDNFAPSVCRAVSTLSKTNNGKREIYIVVKNEETGETRTIPYSEFVKGKHQKEETPTRIIIKGQTIEPGEEDFDEQVGYYNQRPRWYDPLEPLILSCTAADTNFTIHNDIFEIANGGTKMGKAIIQLRRWENCPRRQLEVEIRVDHYSQAEELRRLHEYSLDLNPDYVPIEATAAGEVVALGGTKIYEEGTQKSMGPCCETLYLLSYNIPAKVTNDSVQDQILGILRLCGDPRIPEKVLEAAKKANKETELVEYFAEPKDEGVKAAWKAAFEKVFGPKIVIDDVEKKHNADLVGAVQRKSEIETVKLHPALTRTLCKCGVKTVSEAVTARKIQEYDVNPAEAALVAVADIADEIIDKIMPGHVERIRAEMRVVKSVQNPYGQRIESGAGGYVDPFLRDCTIFIHRAVVNPKRTRQLIEFIIRVKLMTYRLQVPEDDLKEVQAEVLEYAEELMTKTKFYEKIRGMLVNLEYETYSLIERTLESMQAVDLDSVDPFDPKFMNRFSFASLYGRVKRSKVVRWYKDKDKREAEANQRREEKRLRKEKEREEREQRREEAWRRKREEERRKEREKEEAWKRKMEAWRRKMEEKERKKEARERRKRRRVITGATGIEGRIARAAAIVLVGGGAAVTAAPYLGQMGARFLPDGSQSELGMRIQNVMDDIRLGIAGLAENLPDVDLPSWDFPDIPGFGNGDDGFKRPGQAGGQIGVNMERGVAGNGSESGDDYMRHQMETFISDPQLEWGYWMSEQSRAVYTGKGWLGVPDDAPSFKDPEFPTQNRIAHYQVVGSQERVTIRNRHAAAIDQNSIELLLKNGSTSTNFTMLKKPSGEYDIQIYAEDVVGIVYHTVNAIDWIGTARQLTDNDFAGLDQEAYAYYTATPNYDLSKIRFKSKHFPQFSTLKQFMDYLYTLSPFDAMSTIRGVIGSMRYTVDGRTERAYRKFHAGELPQKDFLDFVLSSDELDEPGDGDCDCQNSLYAILGRLRGLPTKINTVVTDSGAWHAPASTFLPGIGWIETDTMGERQREESIVRGGNEYQTRGNERDRRSAAKRMQDILKRHAEFYKRECDELW